MTSPEMAKKIPARKVSWTPITFEKRKYRHFIVRYRFSDTGNIIYQFFSEEPGPIEVAIKAGKEHPHVAFHPKFKDTLIDLFKKKITIPGALDIGLLKNWNSFSVIGIGLATSPGKSFLLEPLFEELDKRLEETKSGVTS